MTTRVETTGNLRSAPVAPRRLSRVDLAVSSVGVLVYSFVIWLLVFALLPMLVGLSPTVVSSGSMSPLLREGDVVLIADHPGTGLGPGTVILFKTEDASSSVLHRIVSVEPDGSYRTRGDANSAVDSTPVWPGDIKGVARVLVPYAGLPAHWLRVGAWLQLAAFVVAVTLAAQMARYGARSRGRSRPKHTPRFRAGDVLAVVGRAMAGARSIGRTLVDRARDGLHRTESPASAGAGPVSYAADGRVDLNTAAAADLEGLPGVGPALAERICRHRVCRGLFTTVEDLVDVPGIGPAKLAVLRDAVRVS